MKPLHTTRHFLSSSRKKKYFSPYRGCIRIKYFARTRCMQCANKYERGIKGKKSGMWQKNIVRGLWIRFLCRFYCFSLIIIINRGVHERCVVMCVRRNNNFIKKTYGKMCVCDGDAVANSSNVFARFCHFWKYTTVRDKCKQKFAKKEQNHSQKFSTCSCSYNTDVIFFFRKSNARNGFVYLYIKEKKS